MCGCGWPWHVMHHASCIMWDEMDWEAALIGDDAGTGTDTDSQPPSAWVAVPIHCLACPYPGPLGGLLALLWLVPLALVSPLPFWSFLPFWLGGCWCLLALLWGGCWPPLGCWWCFSGGVLVSPGASSGVGVPACALLVGVGVRVVGWLCSWASRCRDGPWGPHGWGCLWFPFLGVFVGLPRLGAPASRCRGGLCVSHDRDRWCWFLPCSGWLLVGVSLRIPLSGWPLCIPLSGCLLGGFLAGGLPGRPVGPLSPLSFPLLPVCRVAQ